MSTEAAEAAPAWEQAIQWWGKNMSDVLAFTGQHNVVVNSFGDPVIYHQDARHTVIEKGDWAYRDHQGQLHGCPMTLWPSVQSQLLRIAELEQALEDIDNNIDDYGQGSYDMTDLPAIRAIIKRSGRQL